MRINYYRVVNIISDIIRTICLLAVMFILIFCELTFDLIMVLLCSFVVFIAITALNILAQDELNKDIEDDSS